MGRRCRLERHLYRAFRYEGAANAATVVGPPTAQRVVFQLPSALSVTKSPFYDRDAVITEAILRQDTSSQ